MFVKNLKVRRRLIIFSIIFSVTVLLIFQVREGEIVADADVSDVTGDVAYSCATGYAYYGKVCVFNRDGIPLFAKALDTGQGDIELEYDGELLYIYSRSSEIIRCYDRTGKEVKTVVWGERVPPADIKHKCHDGERVWIDQNGILTHYFDNTRYCYDRPPFWKRLLGMGTYQFYIQKPDGEIVILRRT